MSTDCSNNNNNKQVFVQRGRLKIFLTRLSMGTSETRTTGNHGLLRTHWHLFSPPRGVQT